LIQKLLFLTTYEPNILGIHGVIFSFTWYNLSHIKYAKGSVYVVKKIVKFASVGALGSVTNITIFTTLTFLSINYNIASVMAFLVAVTQNYTLNKKWTFKQHNTKTKKKFMKYFFLNFSSFSINLLVLNIIVLNFGDDISTKILAQILGIGVAMGINFLGSYLVIFAHSKEDEDE